MEKLLEKAVALASKVRAISDEILRGHIGREDIVLTTWLALVSSRPAFFLGSPGIDKTGTIQDLAHRIDGGIFYDALMPTIVSVEQLLVESTSIEEKPTENGGRSIRTRDTLGRAASAHLLFADEIWKAEPRVLQTLIDLAKGDGVRHEGQMVATPLLAFLAASNELPDPEGNLGAIWSRMTIRVEVKPLDRGGKAALVKARLARDRAGKKASKQSQISLADVETLRQARPFVEVPDEIVETVLDILQELVDDTSQDFSWAWADDRRFGRIFDVMQAMALMAGRDSVSNNELGILKWLLWDNEGQIPVLTEVLAPYTRTPLSEAVELVNALLSPTGAIVAAKGGNVSKGVEALSQAQAAVAQLKSLYEEAQRTESSMIANIETLRQQVQAEMDAVIVKMTGRA